MLTDLIEHPEKVKEKKEMDRSHTLRNYSWDKIADQMEALYLELVNGNLK